MFQCLNAASRQVRRWRTRLSTYRLRSPPLRASRPLVSLRSEQRGPVRYQQKQDARSRSGRDQAHVLRWDWDARTEHGTEGIEQDFSNHHNGEQRAEQRVGRRGEMQTSRPPKKSNTSPSLLPTPPPSMPLYELVCIASHHAQFVRPHLRAASSQLTTLSERRPRSAPSQRRRLRSSSRTAVSCAAWTTGGTVICLRK